MASRKDDLLRLLTAMHQYPALARHIKSDPQRVADMFGFQLSERDIEVIKSRLDVDAVLSSATDPETMAVKSVQAMGLESRSD